MPRIPYRMAVPGVSSVFSFPTFTLPAYSVARASIVGPIALQGPHQGAQKSTKTGVSDFSTSWSKAPSVKVSVFSAAMSLSHIPEGPAYPFRAPLLMMLDWTRKMQLRWFHGAILLQEELQEY